MSLNNPKVGQNHAVEFSVPGQPWITSSIASSTAITTFDFPKKSSNVSIVNYDNSFSSSLKVSTSLDGMMKNECFIVNGGNTVTLPAKADRICVLGNSATPYYSIAASLTSVPITQQPQHLVSPLSIAPTIWLRSDLGITLDSGVSQWADQSGYGNNFVQATPIRQPTIISNRYNGLPGLWWGLPTSSSDTKKLTSSTTMTISGNFEMYFIVYITTADLTAQWARLPANDRSFLFSTANPDFTSRYEVYASYSSGDKRSIYVVGANPPGATGLMTGQVTADKPVLFSVRRTGSTVTGVRDATTVSVTNGNNMSVANNFSLGGSQFNNDWPFGGSIMEFIYFPKYLSTLERNLLLGYFSRRYSQSWTT